MNIRQNPSAIYRSHIPASTGPSTSTHSLGSGTSCSTFFVDSMPYSLPHVPHIPQNMLVLNNERTNRPNVYDSLHTFSYIPLCVSGRTNWNVFQCVTCIVPALFLRCILHLHIFRKALILNGRYGGDAPSAFSRYISQQYIHSCRCMVIPRFQTPPSSTYTILLRPSLVLRPNRSSNRSICVTPEPPRRHYDEPHMSVCI